MWAKTRPVKPRLFMRSLHIWLSAFCSFISNWSWWFFFFTDRMRTSDLTASRPSTVATRRCWRSRCSPSRWSRTGAAFSFVTVRWHARNLSLATNDEKANNFNLEILLCFWQATTNGAGTTGPSSRISCSSSKPPKTLFLATLTGSLAWRRRGTLRLVGTDRGRWRLLPSLTCGIRRRFDWEKPRYEWGLLQASWSVRFILSFLDNCSEKNMGAWWIYCTVYSSKMYTSYSTVKIRRIPVSCNNMWNTCNFSMLKTNTIQNYNAAVVVLLATLYTACSYSIITSSY